MSHPNLTQYSLIFPPYKPFNMQLIVTPLRKCFLHFLSLSFACVLLPLKSRRKPDIVYSRSFLYNSPHLVFPIYIKQLMKIQAYGSKLYNNYARCFPQNKSTSSQSYHSPTFHDQNFTPFPSKTINSHFLMLHGVH